MDDEQRARRPAEARPQELAPPAGPAGESRRVDGGDQPAGGPGTGGFRMTGAATQDEAREPDRGGDGAQGGEARRGDAGAPPDSAPPDSAPPDSAPPDGAPAGEARQKGTEDETAAKSRRTFWRELPVLLAVALGLTLIIKIFAFQAFYIPSSSMENTLKIGDRVLVNKIVYHLRPIHRGDVIVFDGVGTWTSAPATGPGNPIAGAARWIGETFGVTANEQDFVKRVVGLPGDHVACCDAKGRVTVNGVPLQENSYLFPRDVPSRIQFEVTVPRGELWVMGDHRSVSFDSREHRGYPGGGSIPESKVIGRAFVVVWPLDRVRILPIPGTFQQRALAAAAPAAPFLLGLTGALPLTLTQRRLRERRRAR